MSTLIQNGQTLRIADITATHQQLPAGVWLLKVDDNGFYLQQKETFVLPKKVYGDHSIVKRWIKSYEENTEKNMGIILSGLKGTGKTITAQKFCIDSTLPIIIVNAPYQGPNFVDFITNPILGKCILFIDEYEKVYNLDVDPNCSRDLLSVMDGQYPTHLIFLLTVNDFKINKFLINRLNRIKYKKAYENLEEDVMEAVIDDMLINKEFRDSIYDFFDTIGMVTFDLLTNIIKEMNLFEEDAIACGKHLNLQVEPTWYSINEVWGSKEYECRSKSIAMGKTGQFTIERTELKYLHDSGVAPSRGVDIDLSTVEIEKIGKRTKKLTVKEQVNVFHPIGQGETVIVNEGANYSYVEGIDEDGDHDEYRVVEHNGVRGYWKQAEKEFTFTFTPDRIMSYIM